uniref:Uncharacterized protein n=1 Tax=Nelumbo nucifera TaxID=4432 RepID=A0A822Y2C5_NELNU|nr:TPA_asm: hypothetical protein HUJ06_027581 [Nelumbo nucifera]
MVDETTETRNNARLAILELANMISVPMSLNAIVHLKVPDTIWQGGSNVPLSASETLARVLPIDDPENFRRQRRSIRMNTEAGERKMNKSALS